MAGNTDHDTTTGSLPKVILLLGVFLNIPPNTPSQTTLSDWEFLVEYIKILRAKIIFGKLPVELS